MKKKNSSAAIEFLAVFAILFIAFMFLIDFALFFRQIYLVQTISDETLSSLTSNYSCSSDTARTAQIMNKVVFSYYGSNNDFSVELSDDVYIFKGGKFTYQLTCKTPHIPLRLALHYRYSGIFLYKPYTVIQSNYSVNTAYY